MVSTATNEPEDREAALPWQAPPLNAWAIIGMNHYFIEGRKHLFVAMGRDGRYIKAEGEDERKVFADLRQQALSSSQA